MILVVCLNPALDITHQLPVADWAGVNRPAVVLERAGGKGTNVVRTLLPFGIDLVLLGFAGGTTGSAALRHGVQAGPAIVKPNLSELEELAGEPLSSGGQPDLAAVTAAAAGLRTAGAGAVVVSLGPDGLLAVTVHDEDCEREARGRR
jgi:fructose-1-phosphate kinase PfkB-like protein